MLKVGGKFSSKLNKDKFSLLKKIKEFIFFNKLNEILLVNTRIGELSRLSLTEIIKFLRAKRGLVLLLDEQKDITAIASDKNVNNEALKPIKEKWKQIFSASELIDNYGNLAILQQCLGTEADSSDQLAIYLPLCSRENISGLALFYFDKKKIFKRVRKSLLVRIGEKLAVSLERAYLFEQMQKRIEQFSALYSMSNLINSKLASEDILTKPLPFLVSMFKADKSWLMLYQDGDLIIKDPHFGLEKEELNCLIRLTDRQLEFSLAVLDSGQVLFLNNPPHGVSFPNSLGVELDNVLLIPLKVQDNYIGLIYVANSRKGKFTLLDSQLATSIGIQLSGGWEKRKLQEKLARENTKLEMANRLKSQFLANMSHELRTPMNSIIGYTSCILDNMDGEINEEQRKDLSKVLGSAEHLLQLINDILDISKIEAGKMNLKIGPFNLLDCIDNALLTVEKLANNKGLIIIKEMPCCPIFALGDPSRVRQILLNLLSNAIKFTDQGSISVRVNSIGKYIQVQIEDTGIGIEAKALPYIFEEFRQADGSTTRRYGGTGLGLAITRKLVELQQGNIWADSQVGKGSTFTFSLPTAES